MASEQGNQLELFELTRQSAPRPHRETLGRILLQFRYDQFLLVAMAGIIGLTVVFATGVERGKQLARSERAMLARQQPVPAPAVAAAERTGRFVPQVSAGVPAPVVSPPILTTPATPGVATAGPVPARKKEPVKAKAGKSRYAVQVVTYSQPQLAKRAMDRLRAGGERAFLIIRDGGRTAVYIGPFPSKDHAVEKVAALKTQFHDCFVKTL